jgi:uncharacterized protein YicC (UPF0701 family)
MTGFGRASAETGGVRLSVEIRSVNHRGLDLKIRSAEPDGYCEMEMTRAVRAAVERGAVSVLVREERVVEAPLLDVDVVRRAHQQLELIRREAGLPTPVDLGTVAAFLSQLPGTGGSAGRAAGAGTAAPHGEALWQALRPVLAAALDELRQTRAREGAALDADIGARAARLGELVEVVAKTAAGTPSRYARRLEERLAALGQVPGLDPGRVAQEVALLAERLDVSEELVRLRTHLDHLGRLRAAEGAVGRKLDFVVQEIGRELNTIGSKAQDAAVAALVIDGKAELEKIREQAQNIE